MFPTFVADHLPKGRGKGRKNVNNEKATDDFHFEKFKKQMRRYWCSGQLEWTVLKRSLDAN